MTLEEIIYICGNIHCIDKCAYYKGNMRIYLSGLELQRNLCYILRSGGGRYPVLGCLADAKPSPPAMVVAPYGVPPLT